MWAKLSAMNHHATKHTPAAERQDPDFLIDQRSKKNQEKKHRPLKFFFHRSKLQAGSSKDDYQMKSHLIRAITRPRPTTACSDQLAVRQKAVLKREKAGSRTGICLVIIIGNASLYFGTS
jgi:hypothetical protein